MRHARHIFAATFMGALVLAGCSTEGAGSIEEPLEAGTPVTVTVPKGREETITWEVVIDDMVKIPVDQDRVVNAAENWPDLTCWMITATLTQVDGPEAGTKIGVGGYGKATMHPKIIGIQPGNSTLIPEFSSVCDDFTTDVGQDPEYHTSLYDAPGNGNSIKFYATPPTTTSERPTVMYIGNDKDGYDGGTASYVSIPEQP